MRKQTRSILQEINDLRPNKDSTFIVESRGVQVISAVQNLISLIQEAYDEDQANDMIKRLFNSMRTGDIRKFQRGVKQIRESKKNENK